MYELIHIENLSTIEEELEKNVWQIPYSLDLGRFVDSGNLYPLVAVI